jgi:hypothetical protein
MSILARCQWLILIIQATCEAEIWRMVVQDLPRQIAHKSTISKIGTAKWTGGVVQVVLYLLCKCEALSPIPASPTNVTTHQSSYLPLAIV